MRIDGVSGIAVVLIASFAIDRIVSGLLFVASLFAARSRVFPDPALLESGPARSRAEKKQKVLYFLLAGVLAMGVVGAVGNVRILSALGFSTHWLLDIIFTGLLLMGGADRVAELLKMAGAPGGEKPASRPIEITGRLTLEDSGRRSDPVSDRSEKIVAT